MSRRKPRFTPDPPPYNATGEQILAWVNAQLLRIEDYWPRDDGDRISALEELQGALTGEWSISGQSNIRFEGTISQPVTDPAYLMWTLSGTSLSESDYDAFPSFVAQGWTNTLEIENDELGNILSIDGATLRKSTDAVTWSDCTDAGMNSSANVTAVWSGQRWVIVGKPSGVTFGYRVAVSSDLSSWTEKATSSANVAAEEMQIASDGNGNLAVGLVDYSNSTRSRVLYSGDHGETWTLSGLTSASGATRFGRIFYKNGFWFGLGYSKTIYKALSPSGTWSLVSSTGNQLYANIALEYGDGKYLVAQNDAPTPRLLSSTDGESWTDEGAWYNTNGTKALFFDDTDKWIFVSGGQQLKSSDGSSWSTITNNFPLLTVRGVTKIYRTLT